MRFAIPAAFALMSAFGANAGCVCERNAKNQLGKVSASVDVKLVEKKTSGPNYVPYGKPEGGLIATKSDYVFVFDAKPPLEIPAHCFPPKSADVSAAEKLDRMAYRCNASASWRIVWISHASGEPLQFDLSDLGPRAPAPDSSGWLDANSIPILSDVAVDMLLSGRAFAPKLFNEIRRDRGDAGLAEALSKTAAMPETGFRIEEAADKKPVFSDDWLSARRTLDQARQAAADGGLRKVMDTPNSGLSPLIRASAVLGGTGDASFYDRYGERLYEIEAAAEKERLSPGYKPKMYPDDRDAARNALLHDLIAARPQQAGKIGCLRAGGPWPAGPESLGAVGLAKTPCPAVAKHLETMPLEKLCTVSLTCDAGGRKVCTPDELARRADEFMRAPFDKWERRLNGYQALVFAGYALGSMPMGLSRRLARASYTIEMPAAPDCDVAKAGEPCSCHRLLSGPLPILCPAPADQIDGQVDHCTYRFDDAGKRVWDVRRR